jgi:acyl CoA:acetate/3-ketoacid CoA transferase alpha subunit
MANTILPGYLTEISNKYELIVDHTGPASYATGGETINAADFGIGGIETIAIHAVSSPGGNGATVVFSTTAAPTGVAVNSVKIKWFTTASMATESTAATNLSAQSIRLQIRGV